LAQQSREQCIKKNKLRPHPTSYPAFHARKVGKAERTCCQGERAVASDFVVEIYGFYRAIKSCGGLSGELLHKRRGGPLPPVAKNTIHTATPDSSKTSCDQRCPGQFEKDPQTASAVARSRGG